MKGEAPIGAVVGNYIVINLLGLEQKSLLKNATHIDDCGASF